MGVVKVYGVDTVTVNAVNASPADVDVSQGVALFSSGNVFTVTYNRTKLSEIREAVKRGKVCVCEYNGVLCWMDSSSGLAEEAFFAGVADGGGSGKVLIQCVSMAEVDGSTAWINWTVDPTEKSDDIFRVTAFETSYDEIAAAHRAGKLCVCRYLNRDYILGYIPAGYYGYAKFYVNDEYGFNILQLMAGTREWSVVEKPYPGGASSWDDLTDKPFDTIDDNTLSVRDGVLSVNTTDVAEQDNTQPITSSGVHVIVGNIDTLLSLI